MFGSTGTADGSSPFPQLRVVALTARAGRAMLGAVLGSSRAGEQTLLKRLARRRPDLFAGRVTCFDRNFPGHELITRDPGRGRARHRPGERHGRAAAGRPAAAGCPTDPGMTWLNAPSGKKEDRLPVRVAEHNVGPARRRREGEVSETCTVITTLLDHEAAPADAVRDAYLDQVERVGDHVRRGQGHHHRRREPHQSGPVLRSGSPRLVIQEAWAWLAGTQLVRASEAAALRSEAGRGPRPAPQGRTPRSPPTRNPSPPPGATPSAP